MYDHRLPKTVRNEILSAVQAIGLNPLDFAWSDQSNSRDYTFSRLSHRPTGYVFEFAASSGMGDTYLTAKWSPADQHGRTWQNVESRDDQVMICVRDWLQTVKIESDEPDLWAALRSETKALSVDVADANDRFTPEERRQLWAGLKALQDHLIVVTAATPAQQTEINGTFREMGEASERLTKRDWKNLFVGALITQLVSLAASPTVFHSTLELATKHVWPLLGALRALTGF